jgi:hypothetical protein
MDFNLHYVHPDRRSKRSTTTPITFKAFIKTGGSVTKRTIINGDNKPSKYVSRRAISHCTIYTLSKTLRQLPDVLDGCEHNTAFALANNIVMDSGVGRALTFSNAHSHCTAHCTLQQFYYTKGLALLLIDIDHRMRWESYSKTMCWYSNCPVCAKLISKTDDRLRLSQIIERRLAKNIKRYALSDQWVDVLLRLYVIEKEGQQQNKH